MVNATVRSSLTIPEFTQALSERITSLARTHALITKDLAQVASFDGLLGGRARALRRARAPEPGGTEGRPALRARGAGRHGPARAHHHQRQQLAFKRPFQCLRSEVRSWRTAE
ncbi:hypothetical protein MKK50_05250 [Methylobacterium sp. J-043]|nr:hypothetical protein [Methylobacterium sp. J-043]